MIEIRVTHHLTYGFLLMFTLDKFRTSIRHKNEVN